MQANPTTPSVDILSAEHVETITDALLMELREHLEEAQDLVHAFTDRQIDEPCVKLADARSRLHMIRDITDALDVLDPPGWQSVWKPAGWHEAIKDAMPAA